MSGPNKRLLSAAEIEAWLLRIKENDPPPALQSFHLFPKLPRTVQTLIWTFAFHLSACVQPHGVYVAWMGPQHKKSTLRYTNLNLLPPGTPQYEPECWGESAVITGKQLLVRKDIMCLEGPVAKQEKLEMDELGCDLIAADADVDLAADPIDEWDLEADDPDLSTYFQHVVVLFPETGLKGLLHASYESRRAVLEAFREWVLWLWEDACEPLDKEGRVKEWDSREEDKKNNGEQVLKVLGYHLEKMKRATNGIEARIGGMREVEVKDVEMEDLRIRDGPSLLIGGYADIRTKDTASTL